eukprot:CFRG7819T1
MSVAEAGTLSVTQSEGTLGPKTSMCFYREKGATPSALKAILKEKKENVRNSENGTGVSILDQLRNNKERADEELKANREKNDIYLKSFSAKDSQNAGNTKNLLTKDLTEEEKMTMQARLQRQKEQVEELNLMREKRKVEKIRSFVWYLTDEEIMISLLDCDDDDEEVVLRVADTSSRFLTNIRKRICDAAPVQYVEPRRVRHKAHKRATKEQLSDYVHKKLSLDDALASLQNTDDFEEATKDWSPARRQAYKMIDENPNAYYYRFNAPNEKQRNGGWDDEERELFLDRLKEMGADGKWGIFSMVIPGRVGYQCSNYYRSLLEKKEIVDPNYYLDDKGKAKYLFKTKSGEVTVRKFKRKGKEPVEGDAEDGKEFVAAPKKANAARAPSTSNSNRNKKKKNNDSEEEEEFGENWEYKPDKSHYSTKRLRLKRGELNEEDMEEAPNPLPGLMDPITLTEVVMPAISPTGHVLSYSSWVQCLEHSDKCPLTQTILKKEDLVLLTTENIEDYRSKIANSS